MGEKGLETMWGNFLTPNSRLYGFLLKCLNFASKKFAKQPHLKSVYITLHLKFEKETLIVHLILRYFQLSVLCITVMLCWVQVNSVWSTAHTEITFKQSSFLLVNTDKYFRPHADFLIAWIPIEMAGEHSLNGDKCDRTFSQ